MKRFIILLGFLSVTGGSIGGIGGDVFNFPTWLIFIVCFIWGGFVSIYWDKIYDFVANIKWKSLIEINPSDKK